jgi:hypothetical protein
MSLQHLINRDPILFAAILWISMWLLVGGIISFVSGWSSLARVYLTTSAFDGAKWRMQSGRMRWFVGYNNVLTIGASQQGLYLSVMFFFRFMHPPLLVPWSEIKVQKEKGWVFEYVTFTLGRELAIPLRIRGTLGMNLQHAAGSAWPVEET